MSEDEKRLQIEAMDLANDRLSDVLQGAPEGVNKIEHTFSSIGVDTSVAVTFAMEMRGVKGDEYGLGATVGLALGFLFREELDRLRLARIDSE